MKYPKKELAQIILQLSKLYNVKHIVISPGSRNAPLTMGFYEDSFFNCYSIVDERCAAFFALGIAQQTQQTVALVCTSGSALLNYYPAISEAFYSDIPLAVISADRPKYKIDIGDGQTIRQHEVFKNHILYSTQLEEEVSSFEKNIDEIGNAFSRAYYEKGPVHINVPFEEPLYETAEQPSVAVEHTIIKPAATKPILEDNFIKEWNSSSRKMILVGVNSKNPELERILSQLAKDPTVIVFTETTSNLHDELFFPGIDKIIAPVEQDESHLKKLQPQLLITIGGMIISKKVKSFLRKFSPSYHAHFDVKKAYDTFFCLNEHFKIAPEIFLSQVYARLLPGEGTYNAHWQKIKTQRETRHKQYVSKIPFSDFKAYSLVLPSIPNGYNLQLSNSSTVRYSQLFNLNATLNVNCNRGTSGIDGSTSTAIGASVVSSSPTLLITGDLSFFYDSNGLWNDYIPNHFRIILFNNAGGGIFRILPGPKNTENFDTYFETKHNLNAKALCEMFDFDYNKVDDEQSFNEKIIDFYKVSKRPKLLEISTPRTLNDKILLDYFKFLGKNT